MPQVTTFEKCGLLPNDNRFVSVQILFKKDCVLIVLDVAAAAGTPLIVTIKFFWKLCFTGSVLQQHNNNDKYNHNSSNDNNNYYSKYYFYNCINNSYNCINNNNNILTTSTTRITITTA